MRGFTALNKNYVAGLLLISLGVIAFVSGSLLGIPLIVFGILFQLRGRGVITHMFYQVPSNLCFESKLLRLSVVLYLVLLLLAFMISSFEETNLPHEIKQFIESQSAEMTGWAISGILGFLTVYMIGNIGIFFLRPWGRKAYTVGLFGMLFLAPFIGAMVVTQIYSVFETILSILNGVILCLLYLSPAKKYFEKQPLSSE